MKKLTLSFILLLVCSSLIHSQDNEAKTFNNSITCNIPRLFLLEARFGYERNINQRNLIRNSIGIKFPGSAESFKNMSTGVGSIPFHYPVSKGIYLSLGYSFIISTKSLFYISPEVYFNYYYYDKKYYEYCVGMESSSYISLQSMDLNKSGIKLLVGKKVSLNPIKQTRLQFDFFTGFGIQYRQEDLIIYGIKYNTCTVNDLDKIEYYEVPEEELSINWYPTIHIGALLSFQF